VISKLIAIGGEAGVPDTRAFRVVGWEADLRAEPHATSAKMKSLSRSPYGGLERSDKNEVLPVAKTRVTSFNSWVAGSNPAGPKGNRSSMVEQRKHTLVAGSPVINVSFLAGPFPVEKVHQGRERNLLQRPLP
jgi:hypothetical protein